MSTIISFIIKFVLGIAVFTATFLWFQKLPAYLLVQSPGVQVPAESVRFYADTTWVNKEGVRMTDQQIWNRIFTLIDNSQKHITLDFFLFNDFQGVSPEKTRPLSSELTERLVAKKKELPSLPVTFITDPINQVYGGAISPYIVRLQSAGVALIETNLVPLPNSNMVWSAFWRSLIVWFGNSPTGGWVKHPFDADGEKVTLRSWFALLNFKANHRKLVVADESTKNKKDPLEHKMVTIITSSNPHDGSSAHGNVALEVRDGLWESVLDAERAVGQLSGVTLPSYDKEHVRDETGPIKVTLLREHGIEERVLSILTSAQKGDTFSLAMFYLSDRDVIKALIGAANRGAIVRVILDPNKDAFGFEKNGIPNRPVAKELLAASGKSIAVRWCDTHNEQCHAKMFMGKTATSSFLLLGSANFTRRNLENYNLEASVIAEASGAFPAWNDALKYFDTLWENKGAVYTADYAVYQDKSVWKPTVYRMMERTGLSSF